MCFWNALALLNEPADYVCDEMRHWLAFGFVIDSVLNMSRIPSGTRVTNTQRAEKAVYCSLQWLTTVVSILSACICHGIVKQ